MNWNGWGDTIECLEAIFHMSAFDGIVVVCDNGSHDGSLLHIERWASGLVCPLAQTLAPQITTLLIPPVAKPVPMARLRPSRIAADVVSAIGNARLVLVDIGDNLGYAGANNLGLRLLEQLQDIQWFWLLNNDALPAVDAYAALRRHLAVPEPRRIVGSLLLEYWQPDSVQACGARYNRRIGVFGPLLEGTAVEAMAGFPALMACDYPIGASLAVNRTFLREVGLMSEDYFLYAEEIDWVVRDHWPSRARIVRDSVVYHKGGSSTGAGREARLRGLTPDYYQLRGRLLLARRSGAAYLVPVLAASLLAAARRLFRPTPRSFVNALRAIVHGLLGKTGRIDGP